MSAEPEIESDPRAFAHTPGSPAGAEAEADTGPDPSDDTDDLVLKQFEWRLGKDLVRRLDQYLVDRVGYLSRNAVQRLIDAGAVTVNGRTSKASYRPREGDRVAMSAPPPRGQTIKPEPIPLAVIYEDDHVLAIDKQANLVVHPARGVWTGTLVNALIHYGNRWSQVGGERRPGILHRLDRNTTGIMLVAKSDEAHWRLARQFENRTIQKTYLAVCHGVPELRADVIDRPIGRDRYVREKQAIRKPEAGGKPAVTSYQVLKDYRLTSNDVAWDAGDHPHDRHLPPPPTGAFALIELYPKTGRTHQLRVHLSHIGHPIVGDTMYGGRVFRLDDFTFARQALHAARITFIHPATLQPMTLQAPVAADMVRLVGSLRGEPAEGLA